MCETGKSDGGIKSTENVYLFFYLKTHSIQFQSSEFIFIFHIFFSLIRLNIIEKLKLKLKWVAAFRNDQLNQPFYIFAMSIHLTYLFSTSHRVGFLHKMQKYMKGKEKNGHPMY